MNECTTANKRFGEIGVKVIARTSVRPLTVSDNPNGVQLIPNFAKPPGRCMLYPSYSKEISFPNKQFFLIGSQYRVPELMNNRHSGIFGNGLVKQ